MNKYRWIVICKGFGTEYNGKVEANTIEEATEKVINQHEKDFNHYMYDVIVKSINIEEQEIKFTIVEGKIKIKEENNYLCQEVKEYHMKKITE